MENLKKQFENELTDNILNYWVKRVYDPQRKTFIGQISHEEKPDPEAALGVVLISRILWTFSAAYQNFPTILYQKMADEAYRLMSELFWDDRHGGVYWSVKPSGEPVVDSKQIYAQSFALYGFSEYARIFNHMESKQLAVSLFHLMERYAWDPKNGGYTEARAAQWKEPAPDFITPAGDKMNKSMNTHLHVLEAYTNLYRICPQEDVRSKIVHILEMFTRHIINPENHHFHLFFDHDWSVQSTAISYGHDIEGSWLLWEAAEVIHDKKLMEFLKPILMKMAEAVGNEGLDPSGGLYNESDGGHWDKNFHWWPQSEAVVGFYNAWQLTGDEKFRKWSENAWQFIQKYQVDHVSGEWHSHLTPELAVRPAPKVSAWKCPYHNGRMCMEMMRRVGG
jgi:cellobiose epimerase